MFVLIKRGATARRRVRYDRFFHRSYASTSSLATPQHLRQVTYREGDRKCGLEISSGPRCTNGRFVSNGSASSAFAYNICPRYSDSSNQSLLLQMVISDAVKRSSWSLFRSSLAASAARANVAFPPQESTLFTLTHRCRRVRNDKYYQLVPRNYFSSEPSPTDRSNYSTHAKIPTPQSAPPTPEPLSTLTKLNPKAVAEKVTSLSTMAIKAVVSFVLKLPGNFWYYLTHPKERNAKLVEWKELAQKEAHHYWMGTKVCM